MSTRTATNGISPKVIFDFVVTAAAFVITYFGIELDPEIAALISKLAGTAAAVAASPGDVDLLFEGDMDARDLHDNERT